MVTLFCMHGFYLSEFGVGSAASPAFILLLWLGLVSREVASFNVLYIVIACAIMSDGCPPCHGSRTVVEDFASFENASMYFSATVRLWCN
jgi:hypothetical protein